MASVKAAALAAIVVAAPAPAASPLAVFEAFTQTVDRPPTPKGMFRNPVIPGSYPDPSIVRVGRDYFLAASSFTAWPGLPIFRSRDLVHWRQIGHGVSRRGQMAFDGLDAAWQGLYAPDLKHHRGIFYLLSTCYGCGGNFVITARSAAGPWSDPHWLPFEGIDPAIHFEGVRAWVLNNGPPRGKPRHDGHRAIWIQEINLATLRMTGPRTLLVDGGVDLGTPPFWVEGPHLVRRGGRYVLIAAQGGTKEKHAQVVFAADALLGPYLPGPRNPVLTQVGLDPRRSEPVSSAGHADFVRTPRGDWWSVFLGNRPYGPDDLLTNTGREVFLLPVTWRGGWPEILPAGQAVPMLAKRPRLAASGRGTDALHERFDSASLGLDWITLGTPKAPWWRSGGGRLRMQASAASLGGEAPTFLGVRQREPNADTRVRVRFAPEAPGDRAGLVAIADRRHFFALTVAGDAAGGREVRLERRASAADPATGVVVASAPLRGRAGAPVRLRISARGRDYRFHYAEGGRWTMLGPPQDGAILSIRRTGGFVGSFVGLHAYAAPR